MKDHRSRLLYLALLLCYGPLLPAAEAEHYIDFSVGQSRGDFATGQTSTLTQFQVSLGQLLGDYDFSVTVPYLFLQDNVGNETGLGDILLRAGVSIGGAASANSLYATLALKLPTADETRGLGTGERDIGGFLTYTHYFDSSQLSLMGGYIITGDSASQSYNDIMVYGLRLAKLITPWYVYTGLDGRQQVLDTGEDPLELSAGFFYQLQAQRFLRAEGFVGLSNASPDYGITVGFVNWF